MNNPAVILFARCIRFHLKGLVFSLRGLVRSLFQRPRF